MTAQNPVVDRHRLRAVLRRARDAAGKTQKEVAEAMEWSTSKLLRIEHGDVRVAIQDLYALLAFYDVTDRQQVEAAVELARSAKGVSPFDRYADLLSQDFINYLAWESSASVIRAYQPMFVLGLLQTEKYAYALFDGLGFPSQNIHGLWEVRSQRQDLHHADNPPAMLFFVDESALWRRVGGDSVMLEQLKQLRRMADLEHITLRILPFSAGAYPGMQQAFAILEFPDPDLTILGFSDPESMTMVYLETTQQATLRAPEHRAIVSTFNDLSDQLETVALSAQDSSALIEDIVYRMTHWNFSNDTQARQVHSGAVSDPSRAGPPSG